MNTQDRWSSSQCYILRWMSKPDQGTVCWTLRQKVFDSCLTNLKKWKKVNIWWKKYFGVSYKKYVLMEISDIQNLHSSKRTTLRISINFTINCCWWCISQLCPEKGAVRQNASTRASLHTKQMPVKGLQAVVTASNQLLFKPLPC